MSTHFVILNLCKHPFKRLTFFLTCLTCYFLSLLQTVWPICFLFCFLEPHVILHGAGYIPNKKVSITNIWKKGLRPVSFLEPLWICFNNIIDFVSEIALFHATLAQTWTWSNWTPWRTSFRYHSLPGTYDNLQVLSASSNFFSSNFLSHQHCY